MKQYTTPEQTAKLIELGFEKPKSISSIKVTGDIITTAEDLIGQPSSVMRGKITANYSIGELIEMLPPKIDGRNLVFGRDTRLDKWLVCYEVCIGVYSMSAELCDALYDMIVKLKEK